jgi:hypothetical protein
MGPQELRSTLYDSYLGLSSLSGSQRYIRNSFSFFGDALDSVEDADEADVAENREKNDPKRNALGRLSTLDTSIESKEDCMMKIIGNLTGANSVTVRKFTGTHCQCCRSSEGNTWWLPQSHEKGLRGLSTNAL